MLLMMWQLVVTWSVSSNTEMNISMCTTVAYFLVHYYNAYMF